jgi:hypothetical protein
VPAQCVRLSHQRCEVRICFQEAHWRKFKKNILTSAQLKVMALAKLVPSGGRMHTAGFLFKGRSTSLCQSHRFQRLVEIFQFVVNWTLISKSSQISSSNPNSRDKHVVCHNLWVILPVFNEAPYYVVCGPFSGSFILTSWDAPLPLCRKRVLGILCQEGDPAEPDVSKIKMKYTYSDVYTCSRKIPGANCNMLHTLPSALLQLSPWRHCWQTSTPL